MDANAILEAAIEKYLGSWDFNGLGTHGLKSDDEKLAVIELIEVGLVDHVTSDDHPNPHIKALPPIPVEAQIKRIREHGLNDGCLYPTREGLVGTGVVQHDPKAPYTSALREGSPQLDFRVFRMEVLEQYRNDPRYRYEVDDTHGSIYREGENQDDGPHEYHQFGFAFDEKINRHVAAFLRYLHDLTPEQQVHWQRYEVAGDHKLHPDYYGSSILGQWPENVSVFDAFLEEKKIINIMCEHMGKPKMFKTDYEAYRRPSGFGFMVRPTKKEFSDFCLQLDQLLSDDMDRKFFAGDLVMEKRGKTEDGEEMVQAKGTITLLQEWMAKFFSTSDPDCMKLLMTGFRKVREARMKPAHKVEDNVFDEAFYQEQRQLMIHAYGSVRTLRQCFANHPKCKDVEVPGWLFEGKIWTQ